MHFTSRREWEQCQAAALYQPDAFGHEGFVHLSFGHQLARAANEHAYGCRDLVLLVVDPAELTAEVRIENGFPHLYGPIPVSAVRLVVDFPPGPDGSFELPDAARLAELALTALPSFDDVLERCRSAMAGFSGPWWIGGGWACDAAAGEVSRVHLDVDVVVLRPDVAKLRYLRDGSDVRIPRSGTLVEWDGRELTDHDHQFWLRPDEGHRPERWQDFAADPAFFEILVEYFDTAEQLWEFRRDRTLRAPLARLGAPGGFLQPEVALLYKGQAAARTDPAARAKAQADFAHAAPHLDAAQRAWLAESLQRVHATHPWIPLLAH